MSKGGDDAPEEGRLDGLLRSLMAETAGDRTGKSLARRFWQEVLARAIAEADVPLIIEIIDRHDGPIDRPARRGKAGAARA